MLFCEGSRLGSHPGFKKWISSNQQFPIGSSLSSIFSVGVGDLQWMLHSQGQSHLNLSSQNERFVSLSSSALSLLLTHSYSHSFPYSLSRTLPKSISPQYYFSQKRYKQTYSTRFGTRSRESRSSLERLHFS